MGRLNLNSRFVPEGKRLVQKEGFSPSEIKARVGELLLGTPDIDGSLKRCINTDWYYFLKMESYFNKIFR